MRMMIVFFVLFGAVIVHASSCDAVETKSVEDSTSQSVIELTKVYNDTIIRHFSLKCYNLSKERLRCHGFAEGAKAVYDSVFIKVSDKGSIKQGYFELSEIVYDDAGLLAYSYNNVGGFKYDFYRYDHGKLVYNENGCDTINSFYKERCISYAKKRKGKIDSLGRYVWYQEQYVWDEKGRMLQRSVWSSDQPSLNKNYTFVYGSPCDTVRVYPIDDIDRFGTNKKGRYDGSFGKMPEIGDPEYVQFAENPYLVSIFVQEDDGSLLARQKKRCEDYKKSLKKGIGKTR